MNFNVVPVAQMKFLVLNSLELNYCFDCLYVEDEHSQNNSCERNSGLNHSTSHSWKTIWLLNFILLCNLFENHHVMNNCFLLGYYIAELRNKSVGKDSLEVCSLQLLLPNSKKCIFHHEVITETFLRMRRYSC